METIKLMSGDKVYENTFLKRVCTVETVEPTRVYLREGKCYSNATEIDPIPLSVEIMKKNNFRQPVWHNIMPNDYDYKVVNSYILNVRSGEVEFQYHSELENVTHRFHAGWIHYFHELQQFIRSKDFMNDSITLANSLIV